MDLYLLTSESSLYPVNQASFKRIVEQLKKRNQLISKSKEIASYNWAVDVTLQNKPTQDDFQKATDILSNAIEKSNEQRSAPMIIKANFIRRFGQIKEADSLYYKALSNNPSQFQRYRYPMMLEFHSCLIYLEILRM